MDWTLEYIPAKGVLFNGVMLVESSTSTDYGLYYRLACNFDKYFKSSI